MSQFTDPSGYNKADAEFRERDEKLLQEMRTKLDAHRKQVDAQQHVKEHWMKCPKCGGHLKEVDFQNVKIDQCELCGGVFFDPGELGMLLGNDPRRHSMLKDLFSWLPRWEEGKKLLRGNK